MVLQLCAQLEISCCELGLNAAGEVCQRGEVPPVKELKFAEVQEQPEPASAYTTFR